MTDTTEPRPRTALPIEPEPMQRILAGILKMQGVTVDPHNILRVDLEKSRIEMYTPVVWCCPGCGSTRVQETAWLWVNTGELTGDSGIDGPRGVFWCEDCEEEYKHLERGVLLPSATP